MKRIALLIAMAIIFAIAIPAVAGPFSDVPAHHWAYDAINKLGALGIYTGYPDGTAKGKNPMTRYEMAVTVARVLDMVAAERQLLAEQVDAVENGLTAGQAEDVIAIFKSLLSKQQPKDVKIPSSLTAIQAEEVAGIVEALSLEFKFELEAIGADIEALGTSIEALEGRVEALENPVVAWSGGYEVELNRTHIDEEKTGTPYLDPFKLDYDEDDTTGDADDVYAETDTLTHELELAMDVKTDNIAASFDIAAVSDDFITADAGGFELADLYATITGDEFEAVFGREQNFVLTSYLFGLDDEDDDVYNGATLTVGNDQYALFRTFDYVDPDADPKVVDEATIKNIFAAKKDLGILDSTMYFGMEDIVESTNFVAGINTPYDFMEIDLTTDVAIQKIEDDFYKYLTFNAVKTIDKVTLEGNYTIKDNEFVGYYADGVNSAGYDVRADIALGNVSLMEDINLNGRFESYTDTVYGFGADAVFMDVATNFDMEWAADPDENKANRTQFGAEYTTDISMLNVVLGYNYDQYDDAFDFYVDGDGVALDELNNLSADLTADLMVPGLTGTASYVISLEDDVDYATDQTLSTHAYGVAYEYDILSASFDYDIIAKSTELAATVDPEAYEFMNVSFDPIAGFEMYNEDGADATYNYNVGLDVAKNLNAKTDLTYGFVYDNRGIAASDALTGQVIKHTATLDYAITADLSAAINYVNMSFDSETDAEDYAVQELTTGLSLSF